MRKYFASQQEDEEVIMIVRKHWISLAASLVSGGCIYLAGLLMMLLVPRYVPIVVTGVGYNIFVLVMSLFFLFNTLFIFIEWLMYYLHVNIITTEHLVDIAQKNLFSRKIANMELENIQDVTASQEGLLQTFYNFGNVIVQTAGEAPNFIMEKAPNPYDIAQRIMELKEEDMRKKYDANTGRHHSI